jgi:hypothetical protein
MNGQALVAPRRRAGTDARHELAEVRGSLRERVARVEAVVEAQGESLEPRSNRRWRSSSVPSTTFHPPP